jgi:hypothetical protein
MTIRLSLEACRAAGHKIYDDGVIWFCYRDHMRTDRAFAAHSREVLAAAQARVPQLEIFGPPRAA